MADLQPIQFKRSFTPGSVPTSSQLLVGEIAINFADKTIYSKNDSDVVVEIGKNYDSDIFKLYHNYKAADSDLFVSVRDVLDSDLPKIIHDYKAADSDLFVSVRDVLDSDLPNLVLNSLKNVNANPVDGQALIWDSENQEWTAGGLDFITVALGTEFNNDSYTVSFDGQTQFTLTQTPSSELAGFRNGVLLPESSYSIDSDISGGRTVVYNASENDGEPLITGDRINFQYVYKTSSTENTSDLSSTKVVENFTASAGQTTFSLNRRPAGDVEFFRNGVIVDPAATSVAWPILTYNPTLNQNNVLDENDSITVSYITFGTSSEIEVAFADYVSKADHDSDIAAISVDVSADLTSVVKKDEITWDNNLNSFIGTTLPNEAVIDRIFGSGGSGATVFCVRYADGTMIQYGTVPVPFNITAGPSLGFGKSNNVTLLRPFIDTNYFSVPSVNDTSYVNLCWPGATIKVSNQVINVSLWAAVIINNTVTAGYLCIGRWK